MRRIKKKRFEKVAAQLSFEDWKSKQKTHADWSERFEGTKLKPSSTDIERELQEKMLNQPGTVGQGFKSWLGQGLLKDLKGLGKSTIGRIPGDYSKYKAGLSVTEPLLRSKQLAGAMMSAYNQQAQHDVLEADKQNLIMDNIESVYGEALKKAGLLRKLISDPRFSNVDPEDLQSYFDSIYGMSPELMSDYNTLKSNIDQAVAAGGVLPMNYEQIARLEQSQKDRYDVQDKKLQDILMSQSKMKQEGLSEFRRGLEEKSRLLGEKKKEKLRKIEEIKGKKEIKTQRKEEEGARLKDVKLREKEKITSERGRQIEGLIREFDAAKDVTSAEIKAMTRAHGADLTKVVDLDKFKGDLDSWGKNLENLKSKLNTFEDPNFARTIDKKYRVRLEKDFRKITSEYEQAYENVKAKLGKHVGEIEEKEKTKETEGKRDVYKEKILSSFEKSFATSAADTRELFALIKDIEDDKRNAPPGSKLKTSLRSKAHRVLRDMGNKIVELSKSLRELEKREVPGTHVKTYKNRAESLIKVYGQNLQDLEDSLK